MEGSGLMKRTSRTLQDVFLDEYEALVKYFRVHIPQRHVALDRVLEVYRWVASIPAERAQAIEDRPAYLWSVARTVLHAYLGRKGFLKAPTLCVAACAGVVLAIVGLVRDVPGSIWALFAFVALQGLASSMLIRDPVAPSLGEGPGDPPRPQPPESPAPGPRPSVATAMPVPVPPLRTRAVARR